MERYANFGGNSGITDYSITPDSITVYFRDGSVYLYNNASTGAYNIAHMKALAEAGQNLEELRSKIAMTMDFRQLTSTR